MNETIMEKAGFGKEVARVRKGLCPICCTDVWQEEFRDALSIKEFGISGMCQKCQDKIFGK